MKSLKSFFVKEVNINDVTDSDYIELEEDPHASKIDPDDPRLSLNKQSGKTLKKGPVIAVFVTLIGLLMIAFTISLSPKKPVDKKDKKGSQETTQKVFTIPDSIRNAPDNTSPIYNNINKEYPSDHSASLPDNTDKTRFSSNNIKQGKINTAGFSSLGIDVNQLDPDAMKLKQEKEMALTSNLFSTGVVASNQDNQKSNNDNSSAGIKDNSSDDAINELIKSMPNIPGQSQNDQNKQERKNDFIHGKGKEDNNYLSSSLQQPISPYEVKAGSVIPVSLITGINSDLPGQVVGQVRENVYDTVTGNHLLIPQGSRLLASYDSMVAYAQDRVLVCWNRLIRPDGSSLDLECSPGVDLAGYAGFSDQVDHHWLRIISGVLVSSVLSAGATTSEGSTVGGVKGVEFDQLFAANVGSQINDVGQQITKKNIEIQPTIKVRPGFSVNVLVTKDMVLSPYQTR